MSQQLVLSINNTADNFRWCWLQDGQTHDVASGNLQALSAAIGHATQQVWLLLPGAKVVTRELEYSEKERRHLRNLLPFQLEDTVVGDIEDLHVALGDAANGKVALAYTDKSWLRSVFADLTSIGLEITRCWSLPLLLPLTSTPIANEPIEPAVAEATTSESLADNPAPTWVLGLQGDTVNFRIAEQQGLALPLAHLSMALELLVTKAQLEENLPYLILRADDQELLDSLVQALPERFQARVSSQMVVDDWALDFGGRAINLCQAEFSQRLPVERWWKLWRSVAILAAVTFVAYIGVGLFHIHKLNAQNLVLRQQMEAAYRKVVPSGLSDDPEKKLRIKLAGLQPKTQSGSVVSLLAAIMPLIAANPDVSVKLISYTADNGEMNINVQASSFSSIDSLRQTLAAKGFTAELLTANQQGDVNSGRLKITRPAH